MNPPGQTKHFSPETHYQSALEEVLFGGGTFSLRLHTTHGAYIVQRAWEAHLLQQPLGLALTAATHDTTVTITLSPLGEDAIKLLNYKPIDIQAFGMNSESKRAFLSAFRTALEATLDSKAKGSLS